MSQPVQSSTTDPKRPISAKSPRNRKRDIAQAGGISRALLDDESGQQDVPDERQDGASHDTIIRSRARRFHARDSGGGVGRGSIEIGDAARGGLRSFAERLRI